MMYVSYKSHFGKEDLIVQENTSDTETFQRTTKAGDIYELKKFPDIWKGKGRVNTGKVLVRALDDNDTILHSFGGIE